MLRLEDLAIANIKPVNLTVEAGECVGLYGESGCGKTRLLRAIADLDEHQGQVYAEDTAQSDVKGHEWRRWVALLPAESQWWFDTIGQHFNGHEKNVEALGFNSEVLHWETSRCSSGEKQRLSLLRMLANSPRVLLLDEPSANLDADSTTRVEELIKNYLEQHHASAIWVSHDRQQLERVCSQRYRMQDGELVAE